ncbi:MAG: BrxA/BrxB family bacilliredoxin [Candidatus Sumerlaeaceae bacterium]|nr:BrxA/BrxB family bacilliredoxin [Candidatus Sumerlaeaceae bacterium]
MSNPFQMAPQYPAEMTEPMRAELTRFGVEDLRTASAVDEVLAPKSGTVLVVVNSVCGCAAGNARPGVAKALAHSVLPDRIVTVFAGVDKDAVAAARGYFTGFQPSSPQIALLKDGEVVAMLERRHIEGASADMVADALTSAFDKFCATAKA